MSRSLIYKINPYIRVGMHSVLKEGQTISRRIIFDYELIFVEKGSFLFRYSNKEYICQENTFLLIRPSIPHSFHCVFGDLSQPHIHFDMIYAPNSTRVPVSFKDVDQLSKSEKEYIRDDIIPTPALSPVVTFKEKEKALELFFEIISEHEKSHILPCKAKMTELIDMLLRDNFPQIFDPPSDNYNITQQIADYIDSGQGFGMKLEDFERQFSYDRFYLEKQFKKQFGIGLIAYKNKKRIQAATYLLKSNTVSQVARMLEFSSVYTFSRAFKSTTGLSPTEYKPK